jgi:hypothetical protein
MKTLALLMILFLAACGPSSDSETHWGDNDEDNQSNSSEPKGLMMSLNGDFEDVPVGESQTHVLTLSATEYDGIVNLEEAQVIGEGFSVDPPVEQWPNEIEVGIDFEVNVIFSPTSPTEYFGELVIDWNGPSHMDGETTVLSLYGNLACIEVSPQVVVFGADVGDIETNPVEVTNCGGITPFELSPTIQHSTQFPLYTISNDGDFPHILDAGESIEVRVRYEPTSSYSPSDDWHYLDLATDTSADTTVSLRHISDPDDPECPPSDEEEANDDSGENAATNQFNQNDPEEGENQSVNDWNPDNCEPGDNADSGYNAETGGNDDEEVNDG